MFTRRPLAGNQLAVFPEATGLDPALMQRIALEMAFPETTFILPLETDDTDVRMRIFTPRRELPLTAEPTMDPVRLSVVLGNHSVLPMLPVYSVT